MDKEELTRKIVHFLTVHQFDSPSINEKAVKIAEGLLPEFQAERKKGEVEGINYFVKELLKEMDAHSDYTISQLDIKNFREKITDQLQAQSGGSE